MNAFVIDGICFVFKALFSILGFYNETLAGNKNEIDLHVALYLFS